MKNEQQNQTLMLKVDPGSTLSNNFLQPATNVLLRDKLILQVEKRETSTKNLETKQFCATSLGFLYPVFRRLNKGCDERCYSLLPRRIVNIVLLSSWVSFLRFEAHSNVRLKRAFNIHCRSMGHVKLRCCFIFWCRRLIRVEAV